VFYASIWGPWNHGRPQGGKTAILPPLEIEIKKKNF